MSEIEKSVFKPRWVPSECPHCEYDRRFPGFEEGGWMQQDNNGPIVSCPMCNSDGLVQSSEFWNTVKDAVDDANLNAEGQTSAYYLEHAFRKHALSVTPSDAFEREPAVAIRVRADAIERLEALCAATVQCANELDSGYISGQAEGIKVAIECLRTLNRGMVS